MHVNFTNVLYDGQIKACKLPKLKVKYSVASLGVSKGGGGGGGGGANQTEGRQR